jgi:adenylyltransferase/sulfurtransferase
MTSRDYQLLNLRYSCPLLRRDQILEGKVPTAPTIASMMAALEVQEALKILHGLPVSAGSALVFNGVTNQFYTTRLPFRDDCLSHETYPAPVELPLGQAGAASALFDAARTTMDGGGPLALALERDLVVALDCPRCGWRSDVFRPRTRMRQSEAVCPGCREPARPELVHVVDEDSPLASRTLAELGVPPYDIVRIDGADASGFFLLAGDREGRADGWGLGGGSKAKGGAT